jgi:NAD(P)-dependent dehydrogenase (short-subunit alcohol dehydrogenase family)
MLNIVVTGANRGIGLALTARFAELGQRVFAAARDPHAGALSALTKKYPDRIDTLALDVNSDTSVAAAAEAVRALTPQVHVLVNMAGISPAPFDARLETVELDKCRAAFETNVLGPLRVTRALLPLLRAGKTAERPARVINVSSGVASISGKDNGIFYAYGISKTALNMLSRTMSFDLKDDGICVVALDPGWVRTDLGGPNAHLAPEESALGCANTILDLTLASTGKFLHYSGSEIAV